MNGRTLEAKENIFKRPWAQSGVIAVAIFSLLAVFLYWQSARGIVYIENSRLSAPIVNLSPAAPGILNALYISEGQAISANTAVALVGSQVLTAEAPGIVTFAPNVIGSYFLPGQTVVSFVKTSEMKVIGSIEENKGLKDVKAGEPAAFSVDAFPGKTYRGKVERISATSEDTGVLFSISDKRPTKKFDVIVSFDPLSYPELLNGMSAKMWIDAKN